MQQPEFTTLSLTLAEHIAEVRLNRPDKSNAINEAMWQELRQAFEWIADADMRLGPVCEAVINGRYYWLPFARLSRVVIDKPEDLRDTVWMPAHFMFTNGGESVGVIPTRYVGSEQHPDPLVRLSRRTEWVEAPAGVFSGLGQRVLATDVGEFPLMDVREILIAPAADSGE